MSLLKNHMQTRIGRAGKNGPAFPETKAGDEIVTFAVPTHWHGQTEPGVTLMVNLEAFSLTTAEARQLAKALLEHADQAEEGR